VISGFAQIQEVMAGRAILRARQLSEVTPPLLSYPSEESFDQSGAPQTMPYTGAGASNPEVITAAATGFTAVACITLNTGALTSVGRSVSTHFGTTNFGTTSNVSGGGAFNSYVFALGQSGSGGPVWIVGSGPSSALGKSCELLEARRGLLRSEQYEAFRRQLSALLSDEDELNRRGIGPSMISLDALVQFVARHQPRVHPNISMDRNGRFSASWGGRRAKVTLVFDQEGGDWTGIDLDARPPVRATGAFVLDSLAGVGQRFRDWIKG
jgi:hypothetical protein